MAVNAITANYSVTCYKNYWFQTGWMENICMSEEEKIDVKSQNKKDDPESTDKENVFDHNPKNADYKKAD